MMRLALNCAAALAIPTTFHSTKKYTLSLSSIHSLLTTLKMPYPQFTFAQQPQPADTPPLMSEQPNTSRARCSDQCDSAATESNELVAKTHTYSKTAATILESTSEEPQTSSLPSRSQPINIPRGSQCTETVQAISCHPPKYTYKCTLCWKEKEPPCYTIGTESRIVCMDCWRWVHSVSICWKCNEVVYRKEDAISFGWC